MCATCGGQNDPSGSVVTATTPHFTLAAKRIQNGMVDGVIDPNDRTPGVIVRGACAGTSGGMVPVAGGTVVPRPPCTRITTESVLYDNIMLG